MTNIFDLLIVYLAVLVPLAPVPTSATIAGAVPNTTTVNASTPIMDRPGVGKPGIAWPLGNDPSIEHFKTWKVDKYYTWSPWCVDFANSVGMKCCPMLWGPKQIADFTNLVKPGYASYALGFNEPDQPGQANLNISQAVQLWSQYLNPLKDQGYYLVSPACTGSPAGIAWIQNFMGNCTNCQVDAIAFHWYGTDPQAFITDVTNLHNIFNKPIWVTEFACQNFAGGPQCTQDQVFNFMGNVTAWMDNSTFVEEYFAFGAAHNLSGVNPANQLLGDDGFPTQLGYLYIGSRDTVLASNSDNLGPSRYFVHTLFAWILVSHLLL